MQGRKSIYHTDAALQELGLPENLDIPVLAFIGRLDEQKGVDLIRESFDWLMSEGVQLILLGSGREDLENSLRYSVPSPCPQAMPVHNVSDASHAAFRERCSRACPQHVCYL